AGLGISIRIDGEAERFQAPFAYGAGYSAALEVFRARPTASLHRSPSLREVTAVTDALRESFGRTGVNEVVLPGGPLSRFPYAVLLDNAQTRAVGGSMV